VERLYLEDAVQATEWAPSAGALRPFALEQELAEGMVFVGLGRIVALCYRSSTSYQIR
jgi:hypothetical protein